MKHYLFILALLLILIGCTKDEYEKEDKKENFHTFSFIAKSTYYYGMWSIPGYEFVYNEDYSSIVVEANINGHIIKVYDSPSTTGTLYYKLNVYDEGRHQINIYNVEKMLLFP